MRVFPRSFPTLEIANQYEIQPEKIANRVYANRMGNGDEASGDGWKYRGANYLQNTGKDNWDMVGMTPENCFITLTFNDENLISDSLNPRDFVLLLNLKI